MTIAQNNKALSIKNNRIFLLITFLLLTGIFNSCVSVGPDYTAPQAEAPEKWHTELKDGLQPGQAEPSAMAEWWTTLNDPLLSELISLTIKGNLDLEQAKSRVCEVRARYGISRAAFFPALEGSGAFSRIKSSENSSATGTGSTQSLYNAGFDAGWEIDIFGGVRRSVEAAEADFQASNENLRYVLVSLLAETALNYVELRTYQTRLNVAEANLKAQEETYDLIGSRYKTGLSNELALQQARYNLESTRSQIPLLHSGLTAAANRLAVLTGQKPGELHQMLLLRSPIPVTPTSVTIGVPAETLRQRPDIRKAERELAAQTARIGVAVSDLYPKFRLSGSIGLESLESSDFFSSGSRFGSFGPAISWKIFSAGSVRKNIMVQSEKQKQYLLAYEAAILTALEEVENCLTAYAQEQLRRERLSDAVDAAKRAKVLAEEQYKAGLINFSDVLDSQRSLLSFQDQLAQSAGTVTSNLIKLYKALGGGWEVLKASDGD